MKVNWKEFRKNHPEDFRKCCGTNYLRKCKCKNSKLSEFFNYLDDILKDYKKENK